MHMYHRALVCALVLTLSSLLKAGDDAKPIDEVARARELFKSFLDGKDEQFREACDEAMRTALPPEKLVEVRKGILASLGAYEAELNATRGASDPYVVVDLLSKFASSKVTVRFVFEKGVVAGFRFLQASDDDSYQPPAYADPSKFYEEVVTVRVEKFELPGTLTLPAGDGRFPAVVLVHGSGPHDQDETLLGNKPFKDIAWGLASRGIAVLRYEKRTKKYGAQMDAARVTIDEETVDDALAAARMLMAHKRVDPKRVFVAGHSLGATAAPYIGTKEPKLAGIIMMAAAARPIYELVGEQLPYIFELDGKIDKDEQKQLDDATDRIYALRNGIWKPTDKLLGVSLAYWAELDRLAPAVTAAELKMRVLIMQGGRDYQVSAERDFGLFKAQLAGRGHVTLKLFDKLDHLMRAGEGKSTPESYTKAGHVAPEVISFVAEWIAAGK